MFLTEPGHGGRGADWELKGGSFPEFTTERQPSGNGDFCLHTSRKHGCLRQFGRSKVGKMKRREGMKERKKEGRERSVEGRKRRKGWRRAIHLTVHSL